MTFIVDTHPLVGTWKTIPAFRRQRPKRWPHRIRTSSFRASFSRKLGTSIIVNESRWRPTVHSKVARAANCAIYPLDEAVLELFPGGLDIHDAIVVATAKVYRDVLKQPVRLITCDDAIVRSGIIETMW